MKKKENTARPDKKKVPSGPSFTVSEKTELMTFLMTKMEYKSRNKIKSLLGHKMVLVDGATVTQFNHPLLPGQKVQIGSGQKQKEKAPKEYTIVFEDADIIVIDKQAGLLSIATDDEKRATAYSLLSQHVKKQNRDNKIFIVHRLDRDTSGLLVFAKSENVKRKMQDSWDETVLERTYIAVVEGCVEKNKDTISSFLFEGKTYKMHSSRDEEKGQKAITHYQVLKKKKEFSLLKVNLETGRKNQIRVHMQEIGHSIVGDRKYGALSNPLKRMGLHAQKLAFLHPSSGKKMYFESETPASFLKLF